MSSILAMGTIFTAIGFGLGGIMAWGIKGLKKNTDAVLCLCAGLILGLLSFEVAPEAIELGNWFTFIAGVLAGVFLFNFLHGFFRLHNVRGRDGKKPAVFYTGLMLLVGISIHNIPIGISLGAVQDTSLSRSILQMILLHNIPEGLIVFTPLLISGVHKRTMLLLSVLVSLPVGAGAFIGSNLEMPNPLLWSAFISLSIGMIYMVTIKEILIESIHETTFIKIFMMTLLGFCLIGAYFTLI
ncbi:ZIP family metal transporter [Paenisporosarcina sp. NPDC076898]|uniref:ZIP family metal transporter n=1 Tax=unclassified Paenisporosarcina TaxID=2642018 RepID=UPI003D038DE8